jgi:putative spermidine/putrescine transport system permease protein
MPKTSFGARAARVAALAAYVLILMLFILGPVVATVAMSFTSKDYLSFPPSGFSLKWYELVLSSNQFMGALSLSITVAVLTVLLVLAASIPASYAIVRYKFRGQALLGSLYNSPLLLPQLIIGVSLLQFLSFFKIGTGIGPLVLGHAIIAFPFAVRFVTSGLHGYDKSMEDAATSLGSGTLRTFFRITFPVLKAPLVSAALFAFLVSFENVNVSVFLSNPAQTTAPVLLFSLLEAGQDPSIAAFSAIFLLLGVGMILALHKLVGLQTIVGR